MLIDWFTVAAQVVNFLVLVWLLKRFLYRPVLGAIDAREKKIAAQLTNAAQREAQAQAEREEFERRNAAFQRERADLLHEATAVATAERERLMEAARQDSQLLRAKLSEVVAAERKELGRRLSLQTQAEVFALTRKALADLAGVGIEERMVEVFIDHLRALPEAQRGLLGQAMGTTPSGSASTALVRSAFELPLPARARIKNGLTECLGGDVALRFETVPGLICGVELTIDGVKLAWSVTDYLASMAESVTALVTAPATADPPQLDARHG